MPRRLRALMLGAGLAAVRCATGSRCCTPCVDESGTVDVQANAIHALR
ncbi:MAG: hypothetical protein QM765_46330 [Myxococcales bacterium]